MAIDLTEEQIMVTMRFIVNKMREEEVQINNPEQVLRYMILNPLPDHDTVAAEATKQEEAEKAKRIVLLTEELKRLEGN
jgi:hypothetical protein